MKTAISIPDSLGASIEAFLAKAEMSRSEFFQLAAKMYLENFASRAITANLDRVYGEPEDAADVAFRKAAIEHFRDLDSSETR